MLFQLASAASTLAMAAAAQVVYNGNFTKGYVQGSDGSLARLKVPTTPVSASDIANYLSPATAPPGNAQLVISESGSLMAVWGQEGCNKNPIIISQYSEASDSWTDVASSPDNWYLDGAVVWYDWSSDIIYFYGGECAGTIQKGFYAYNVVKNTFEKASASPMPREMAYARAINLDRESVVVVGGQANSGWLSMQQVAFWEYKSWTYRSVSASAGVDSRNSPLVLPLWSASTRGNPVVNKLLVIGGVVNNRVAKPEAVVLEFNTTNGWAWASTDIDSDGSYLTLYNSLVDYDSGQYTLYDGASNWQKAQIMSVPTDSSPAQTTSSEKSSSKFNAASIATLSTVIPVITIAIALGCLWWWWRKRQQRRNFLRCRPVLSTPDMASIAFDLPGGYVSPYRTDNSTEHDDQSVRDVQFLVSNRRQALRVVNPDEESVDGLSVMSHRRARSGQSRASHKHSRSKSTSSNISGDTVDNPFDDKFDFENTQ